MITYTFSTTKNPTLSQIINALSSYVMSYSTPLSSNITINGSIGLSMKDNVVVSIQIMFFENASEYTWKDSVSGYTISAQPLASIPSQSEIQSLIGDYL
ncbi:MAG: hypothetical protein QXE05_12780 [Nitrososphaeria archaeon]|nr:hypothetical protein [Candidatus Jingweiarchaeum tengchongense]